jgi:uncharacterized protein (PEP-CTERM system associated)
MATTPLDRLTASCLAGLLGGLGATTAMAQTRAWVVEPAVEVNGTATSNSAYSSSLKGPADAIITVSPSLRVSGSGSHVRVNGQVQLDSVSYGRHTQPDRVLPQGAIESQVNLIERFLGVDASLTTRQTTSDPFAPQGDGSATTGRYTTTTARISPFIERDLTPELSLKARADVNRTHYDTTGTGLASRPDGYAQHHSLRLARVPTPLGAAIEADYIRSGYSGYPSSELTQPIGRGVLSYALNEQLILSGIVGHESNQTQLNDRGGAIQGLRVDWHPNERVHLLSTVEHRFFGLGWDAVFTHRTPTYAGNLALKREITSSANSLTSVSSGGSLSTVLGEILKTRFPNDNDRANEVRDVMNSRGLTDRTNTNRDLYALSVQLRQAAAARMVFMGRRDTVSFTFDLVKSTPQPWAADPLISALDQTNLQRGVEVEFNHRLTPLTSFDITARWAKNSTPDSARSSTETTYRAGFNTRLSPQTTATIGVRQQQLDSSVLQTDVHESAMFLGLGHRF